jgi:hypothetical protein
MGNKYPRLSKLVTYNAVAGHVQRAVQRQYDMLSLLRDIWDKEFPLDLLGRDAVNERVDEPIKGHMLECLDELERLGKIASEIDAEVDAFREEFAE